MNTAAVNHRLPAPLLLLFLLCASPCGLFGTTAGAQETRAITVSGSGVVEAMPDSVELAATVEGNAELAGDAVEKFRGNKRRAVEALNRMNVKGMTVAGGGPSLNSGSPVNLMAALQGQADQAKVADKVAVQEQLIVTLSGIDAMNPDDLMQSLTRIVDVVKDAGATMGSGPKSMIEMQFNSAKPAALATFKLSKFDAHRQQAYEAALQEARAKAERLAQLAGVSLGDIVSIRETAAVSADDKESNPMAAYLALFGAASGERPQYTASEFKNIPVTVTLSVQFDIAAKK